MLSGLIFVFYKHFVPLGHSLPHVKMEFLGFSICIGDSFPLDHYDISGLYHFGGTSSAGNEISIMHFGLGALINDSHSIPTVCRLVLCLFSTNILSHPSAGPYEWDIHHTLTWTSQNQIGKKVLTYQ